MNYIQKELKDVQTGLQKQIEYLTVQMIELQTTKKFEETCNARDSLGVCKHNYKFLGSNTFNGEEYWSFFCEKCLDIQHRRKH